MRRYGPGPRAVRRRLGRRYEQAGTGPGRLLADAADDGWAEASPATGETDLLDGPVLAGQAGFRLMGEWPDGPQPLRLLDDSGPEWPEDAGYAEPGRRHRPARADAPPGRHETGRRARRPGAVRPPRGPGAWPHGPGSWHRGRLSLASPRWLTAMARQPWYIALSRYRWYVSIGAGAGVMALASGVILILPRQSPTDMMNGCGLMPCKTGTSAAHRGQATAVATPEQSVSAHPPGTPATAAPRITVPPPTPISGQAATAQAISTPPATVPAPAASTPAVRARYQLVSRWNGGIVGQFSIVNAGAGDLTNWQLVAAFPGDQIQFVIGAADAVTGGDSLILSPSSAGATIPPGGSLIVVFTAWGPVASPSACTIDGASC